MVQPRDRAVRLALASTPVFVAMAYIWSAVEQIDFYGADGGFLRGSGWWGLAGTLSVAMLIGATLWWFSRAPIKVTVAEFSTNLAYLAVYIAKEAGYFRREGLDVCFTQTGGDSRTWREVVERKADFGIADPIAMLEDEATDSGVLVATLVIRSPTRAVTVRAMPPVSTAKSLKGLPLRVFGEDTTSYKLLTNFLRAGGVDPESEDIQIMQPNDESSHILGPNSPVVFTFDPAAAAAVQNGAKEVFNGSIRYDEFLNTGVFVRKSFAQNNAQTVQRFVNALEAAVCFMRANRGFTVDFAIRKFKEPSRNSIMVGVARLFAEGVYPKHVTLDTRLWSIAVAKRFGEQELSKYRFDDHADRTFADSAATEVASRRDWTALRARIRHAFQRRV